MHSLRFLAPTAFAALALCGSLASAATFNLNINGQSPQALIDVMNVANSNGEADTINLSGYVNFTAADNSTYGPTGFPVITNDGPLTINGAGSFFIGRINNVNNPKVRIFAMGPGANVTINNVRFANGSAGAGSGGSRDAVANRGGGIYNGNGGSLALNGCDFDINSAVTGAAIFNGRGATLKVSGGNIEYNDADASGGAIYNEAGMVTLEGVAFDGNNANGDDANIGGNGGALVNRSANANGALLGVGTLTVRNCNFGVVNGNRSRRGGAIASETGSQTIVQNCYFNSNGARFGGAIFAQSALTIDNSTFDGNSGSVEGGAIYAETGADARINNSTFANNRADGLGGALRALGGAVALESCTINRNSSFNNTAGGLSAASGALVRARNTIVAGNSGGDVNSTASSGPTIESGGYNLIGFGNVASNFNATGDQTNVADPRVNSLRRNAGATPTSSLQPGSPAIDRGASALATDQLGVRRPIDIASVPNAANGSDIGAVEFDAAQEPRASSTLVVNTTTDIDDGTCGLSHCTLREAIGAANAAAGFNIINFTTEVFGNSRRVITLNGTRLTAIADLMIIMAPAVGVTIDGANQSGVFEIAASGEASLRNLTIRNGNDRSGAGIYNKGNLTVFNCTLFNNTAEFDGGAIRSDNGRLSLQQSTLSGNKARDGSAVYNFRGTASIRTSTLVSDRTLYSTQNFASSSSQTLMTVYNSIVAGAEAVTSISPGSSGATSSIQSEGYNIVSGGASINSFQKPGDQINIAPSDVGLGALGENGGPTPTIALLAGSPAINGGDPNFVTSLEFDQRGAGFNRVIGVRVDIGAFEAQKELPGVTVTIAPDAPKTNDVLTATVVGSSPTNGSLSYSYQWSRNGTPLSGENQPTLQLSKPGNGDKGDVISVTVRATDSQGTSAPAMAQVTVVNSAPIAISSQGEVPAATEKGFVLRFFDADGDAVTYKRVGGPRNGVTADIRVDPADGQTKLFYKSRPFYGGVDIIRFVVFDSDNKQSNESTLGINVLYTAPPPANRAPIAGDTNIDTFVGTSVVKGLLGSDPDGDAITFRVVSNAKYGTSEIKRDADGFFKLFYTSLNRFYGNDRVIYIVTDSRGKESNLATVNINFINRSPVAQPNNLQVASGELVSQFLFADDPDNDAITFRLVNNPRFGTGDVRRDAQGKWRVYYQSVAGYVGPDRITFIAIDPQGKESQVATATINVVAVTSAPSALRSGGAPATAPSSGGS